MSSHDYKSAQRPQPDELLVTLADYAANFKVDSPQAYETAKYCLMDTLACGFQALKYPACTKLLGPVVPGATLSGGARVPGTAFELDLVEIVMALEEKLHVQIPDEALSGGHEGWPRSLNVRQLAQVVHRQQQKKH